METLQARNEVLRALKKLKKHEMEVKKLEIKMQHEEISMQHDIHKNKDQMALERQKVNMAVRQMEAKFSASKASNVAKVNNHTREAKEKSESYAKRRKSTYFGSNVVSLYLFYYKIVFFCHFFWLLTRI